MNRTRNKLIATAATLALAGGVFLAGNAAFAGIGEELSLAQTHALLAYRTGGRGERGLVMGKMYFQHVLNCLVGPGGQGYDLTQPDVGPGRNPAATAPTGMDPCAVDKTNKGALNDAVSPAQKQKIQAAVDMTKAAMVLTENDKLTEAATALADAIGEAKETK